MFRNRHTLYSNFQSRQYFPDQSGFTLIEIITVLLIIGILTAVALSKSGVTEDYTQAAETHKFINHLRYAQGKALKSDDLWGVGFDQSGGVNSYWLFRGNDKNQNQSIFPGESAINIPLSSMVPTSPLPDSITFNALGDPGPSPIIINTQAGNLTILATTGFIIFN